MSTRFYLDAATLERKHTALSESVNRRSVFFILAAVVFSVLFFVSPDRAAQKKGQVPKQYKEWLERDVVYLITKEERDAFRKLTTDEERDKFIERFWELRNPAPGAPTNPYKEEIYRRIAYADARFGAESGGEGWRTDRGRTYITLGAPQQKQVIRSAANLRPIEIWFYSNLNPSLPPFFYVMFYQREFTGDYRFYSPYVDGPEKLVTATERVSDASSALRIIQNSVGPEVARISLTLLPDEPVDLSKGQPSLQSDILLASLRNFANLPFNKEELSRRRNLLESVAGRFIVEGENLNIVTLPVRDSHGLTRLDYAIRLRKASDLTLSQGNDGRYSYSIEARVRVFGPDHKLIFTQEQQVSDSMDKRRLSEIQDRPLGYEGTLPLIPGKYRLDFLLTDWTKKVGFHAEREVEIPTVDATALTVPGILAFSPAEAVDPAQRDLIPFAMAGVKFTPVSASPLILNPGQSLEVAYQIWAAPKDPRAYTGQKLDVEYALGQPAKTGTAAIVKDELNMEQFDLGGSLVNGKKLQLDSDAAGNFMLTVTVQQPGTTKRAYARMNFRVLTSASTAPPWDVVDPSIPRNAERGVHDKQRGLCYLAQGQLDEARVWFRRALDRDHSDDVARANLVEAYYRRNDYAAVVGLFKDAGVTSGTDSLTLIRIAESLRKMGDTNRAIAMIEDALHSRPEDGPLYLALADCYERIGNPEKAAELTRKGKSYIGSKSPSP